MLHGYGPTFNLDERVQGYTHPLWFILLSTGSLLIGNIFSATFVVSIAISVAAVAGFLWTIPPSLKLICLTGLSIVLSKSFVDFSTSGLENPLSHLILLVTVLLASSTTEKKSRLTAFLLACSALYLNRPDLVLAILPLAAYVLRQYVHEKKIPIKSVLIAAIPVLSWILFSLYYYGFPLPNTAYAKLGTDIAIDERVSRGIDYLLYCATKDPITALVIFSALITSSFSVSVRPRPS